ncbi:unnamed protein product [Oreochromis niloticus]|nr:unnamed protein product [Mustela putorius furo]
MLGRHGKKKFRDLRLFNVVYEALKKNYLTSKVNLEEAEKALSKWFTGAKDRGGPRAARPCNVHVCMLTALTPPPFRVEPAGVRWLTPGLRKYSCQLTIDTNTVNTNLQLSDNNRKVTRVEEVQSYPDHPDRFDGWEQLLCRNGLTGRCYWEVEWRGEVYISVSYRSIRRKGGSNDCVFGWNDQSWSLYCSDDGPRYVRHNKIKTSISSSCSSVSNRAAVYVDCPAGTLSFYRVSSDTLIHLHTFNTTFTQTLYPGFRFWSSASVSLC